MRDLNVEIMEEGQHDQPAEQNTDDNQQPEASVEESQEQKPKEDLVGRKCDKCDGAGLIQLPYEALNERSTMCPDCDGSGRL